MPKRKEHNLFPIESSILGIACALISAGLPEFHGYQMAKELAGGPHQPASVGYGTMYRALDRLEGMGYLTSR